MTTSAEKLDGINGVHIRPGATAFTLMPLLTKLFANARVKPTMVALVAEPY
nr:hypothetical protein [Tissierella pigra]